VPLGVRRRFGVEVEADGGTHQGVADAGEFDDVGDRLPGGEQVLIRLVWAGHVGQAVPGDATRVEPVRDVEQACVPQDSRARARGHPGQVLIDAGMFAVDQERHACSPIPIGP
jgi:hypothetical protein